MKVEQLWSTPIATHEERLSQEATEQLIALMLRRDQEKKKVPLGGSPFKDYVDVGDFYHNIHYNLFSTPDEYLEAPALREFEKFACKQVREYLRLAFDAKDFADVALSARAFGHITYAGTKTFPHYHQQSDLVLIHYLKVDQVTNESPLSLIMLDPRGAPNYPWTGKMHTINPYTGLNVIHPSYVWHETNEWKLDNYRALIAVNFKIIGHGHETQFTKTRF